MNKDINLLDSLINNNSILLNQEAKTWQEAISVSIAPLIKSGAVKKEYVDAIIKTTEKFGPYYIIADGLAMPHARPEDGVIENAFSLVTLKKPVMFKDDDRHICVFIALGATSNKIHVSSALPQVVKVFEDPLSVKKISQAKTKNEVIEIIKRKLGK